MSFVNFDLRTSVERFGLRREPLVDLFADVKPVEPSASLVAWLRELSAAANSEKARSEFIVTPLLVEAKRRSVAPITLHSGLTVNVDDDRGLNGICDFIIARSTEPRYLMTPLLAVVEAKRDDLLAGAGQCVAEMVALRTLNERENANIPAVFGCVTTGFDWRFFRLAEDRLDEHDPDLSLRELPFLLGVLVAIMDGTAAVRTPIGRSTDQPLPL